MNEFERERLVEKLRGIKRLISNNKPKAISYELGLFIEKLMEDSSRISEFNGL